MKKLLVLFLALLTLAALCACSSGYEVIIRNDLDAVVYSVYISPSSDDQWGDPVNYTLIRPGAKARVDYEMLAAETAYYDFIAVDESELYYDVRDFSLHIGDTLALSVDGDMAILTVTGQDGKSRVYDGYAYHPDALESGAG